MSILGNPVCLPIGGKAAKGSQMFLAVSLPRSLYYTQAAEWLKIKDNPRNAVAENQWDGQVVCGGNLWELYGNNAYCYSLENGDLLETVPLTGASGEYCNAICTDGESRIWFVRRTVQKPTVRAESSTNGYWNYSNIVNITLYEINTSTKAVKQLYTYGVTHSIRVYNGTHQYSPRLNVNPTITQYTGMGLIGFSHTHNKVYFGAPPYKSNGGYVLYYDTSERTKTEAIPNKDFSNHIFEYDLTENTGKNIANIPGSMKRGRYFYDDGDFFYVGNGYTNADKEKAIYRYNKLSNIWETISTNFEGYTVGPFSYVQIGDAMLQISKDATGIFDPKTGNLETLSTPVVPPDATVMYPGFKAFSNNILYLVTNQGVYKCPFFSKVPEDAPIVAKIYKGQKYHTLEPFEIPGKLKLLRTQQIADKDYEIKMYEYSSEGGQTIYIEDVGE